MDAGLPSPRAMARHGAGQVLALLADGMLRPVIAARYPLTEAAAALALAESRTINGKIVLIL